MKTLGLILAAVFMLGCHENMLIDLTPPSSPQGIQALALDNQVQLTWLNNPEPDVAGYRVWYSESYNGKYSALGSVTGSKFVDVGAKNGVRYYYGVTAFDFDGNESELSTDVVYATPRPEGFGTKVNEFRVAPSLAGYDFSTYSVGSYDDDYTDFYYEASNGRFYLDVWSDTDIQDMGFTGSLDDIAVAPTAGWAPSKSVEAIPGHTYVIWTWDEHYAKVRVREVSSLRLTFDWAYQTMTSNPELKRELAPDGSRKLHPRSVVASGK